MSNNTNTNILEIAAEMLDDEGFLHKYDVYSLEKALSENDLDRVHEIISRYMEA